MKKAFLLALSDALRPLSDPIEIQQAAMRLLGDELATSRAYYVECYEDQGTCVVRSDYLRDGAPSRVGVYRFDDFGQVAELVRAGHVLVVNDALAELEPEVGNRFAGLAVRAQVSVPLRKNGKLVAALCVSDTAPRAWTALEVLLVQETAERTWAAVERAHAEAALRTSEARFRTLVENVTDYAILMLDEAGRVTEWTPGAERALGYAADEVVGRSVGLFHLPEEVARGEVERVLAEAATTGRAEREALRVRKDGSQFWVNEIVTAVRDREGQVVGFTIVSRDLSEERRQKQQREDLLAAATAAHAEAKRANRAKDEFLATLSHELRTPLSAIFLWGEALRSGSVPMKELGRALDAIMQSAESQSRLIEDLLDLSRLVSGKLSLAPQRVALEHVARTAIGVIQPLAQAKGVTLTLERSDALGHAVLDPARLQQVLWNLLSNAIKFTAKGGRVSLSIESRNGVVEAEVADTGAGIAKECMPRIFERFWQAEGGDARHYGGLGIGLALCRQLVELQGGTISAHSDGLGQGSVFRIQLPSIEPAIEAEPHPLGDSARDRAATLHGVTVLLIEDDEATRSAMVWILRRAGASVIEVGSGPEALAALEALADDVRAASVPCVIVSDLGLPGMNGYELIESIVQRCRAEGQAPLPACAVSAHARDVDRQRAIDAGFDLYLAKPVTPEKLIEAVQDLWDIVRTPPTA